MERRLECCVPTCKRTIGDGRWRRLHDGHPFGPWAEWICAEHWKLVPRAMKRAYSRVKRRERKFGCNLPAGSRIWRRIKIEVGAAPPLGWPGYRRRGLPCPPASPI